MCEVELTEDNSVLTCIHVINNHSKYEYIEGDPRKNCVESFTCSRCLEDTDKSMNEKKLLIVCKKCFIDSRIRIQ